MNLTCIENGSLIEIPEHSNVKAKTLKEALAKIHPERQFVVMSQNDVEVHNPSPTRTPKTIEEYTTLLDIMGFTYKMGGHHPNADMDRMCSIQNIWVNDNTLLSISIDDKTHIIRNIARSELVEPPQPVETIPYGQVIHRPIIINGSGELYRDPKCEPDFLLAVTNYDLFNEWNLVARSHRSSLTMIMAVIDGKVIIAPTNVKFSNATYVEEFTLYSPLDCNNTVRVQFDNLAMKMLGE